jgi:endonuclease/exonuclease/phosphatase family metal-dependent hydrolase
MRVVTWNLWWRNGPWKQRLDAIAETLAEIRPDVCGLQEVWEDASDNLAGILAERLGMHWSWAGRVPNRHWQDEHPGVLAGNAVLSRWPIAEQAEISLPATDDHPRLVLHALIEAPGGSLPFFTTHFSHQVGASAVRQAQARTMAGFVATRAAGHAWPPLVTGDLNAEPDSDELRLLGGVLVPPAVPDLVLLDAWRYTQPGQPGLTWTRRNPYLVGQPYVEARIDYVLAGLPAGDRGHLRSARVAGDVPVGDTWPSDHLAVVVELDP